MKVGDIMNKAKLKSVMALRGFTQTMLAEEVGLSEQRLSAKINSKNGAEFNQGEILKIKKILDLSSDDIINIFFDDLVS
jgi:conserved domain protein